MRQIKQDLWQEVGVKECQPFQDLRYNLALPLINWDVKNLID
ncbi:hypothetical protein [Roseivirga sp.]|jgi:hypothetical protein|nr:hypothetical protein [Roseivirga sp.]